jgi:hypothetical protein
MYEDAARVGRMRRSFAIITILSYLFAAFAVLITAVGHHGHLPLRNVETQMMIIPPAVWSIIMTLALVVIARMGALDDHPRRRNVRRILVVGVAAQSLAIVGWLVGDPSLHWIRTPFLLIPIVPLFLIAAAWRANGHA